MGSESREEVEQLLQVRRYDPDIVSRLEEYVDEQMSTGATDSDANLALLKLYQFYPELYTHPVVVKYLIPAKCQNTEPVPRLIDLLETLEKAGFDDSIREFMLSVVKRTFISIKKAHLMALLNLDEGGLETFVDAHELTAEGDSVKMPPTKENQPKAIKVTEQITFRDIAPALFGAL